MSVREILLVLQCVCLGSQVFCGLMYWRTERECWVFPAVMLGPVNVIFYVLSLGAP